MLRPYYVAYETRHMKEIFKRSGMADYCPIMAHLICLQMTLNQDFLVRFVAAAQALFRARGESIISESTWQEADAAFDWPDGVGTAQFWK